MNLKLFTVGITFSLLWASASTATKIGLHSAQPFVISIIRFGIAGGIMLVIAHGLLKKRLPSSKEWKQLMLYGLLNISCYLGLYIVAMQQISAGLGSLAVAVNPVVIGFIAAVFYGRKITGSAVLSLLLCFAGVVVAAWPLLLNSYASVAGILLLAASMLAYSVGSIYYTNVSWGNLHTLTINGWQTILGGLFMSPLLLVTFDGNENSFDTSFWTGTLWLAVPVSIGAVQCWLILLNKTPITASYWLFLTPVFGFIIANRSLNEPISWYTIAGVMMVITGLATTMFKKEKALGKGPSMQE